MKLVLILKYILCQMNRRVKKSAKLLRNVSAAAARLGSDSKEAARYRRNRENDEFKSLASMLPLQVEITQQLDKASIIRLTMSFLRLRQLLSDMRFPPADARSLDSSVRVFENSNHWIHSCLNGFVFILSNDGKFLYISESVSSLLGLSQIAILGTHIFDYLHDEDQIELQRSFQEGLDNQLVQLNLRFRSNLMRKNNQLKMSKWRLLEVVGRFRQGFVGIALSIDSQYFNETTISHNTIVFKLNMSFQIESIENYSPLHLDQTVGQSIFELCHPIDLSRFVHEILEVKTKEYARVFHRLVVDSYEFKCHSSCHLVTKTVKINTIEASREFQQLILVVELF